VTDAITRLLRADRVLTSPDPVARAAYDARLAANPHRPQETEIGA
jgi:hypothetical protein